MYTSRIEPPQVENKAKVLSFLYDLYQLGRNRLFFGIIITYHENTLVFCLINMRRDPNRLHDLKLCGFWKNTPKSEQASPALHGSFKKH